MGALLSIFFSTVTADHPASTVFGDNPAILPVRIRKEHEGDIIEHVSLKELLKTRVPSLFTPFQPLWYLFKCVSYPWSEEVLLTNLPWQWSPANTLLRVRGLYSAR